MYVEDETPQRIELATQLNQSLAALGLSLDKPTKQAIAERDGTVHRCAGPGNDIWQPVACGGGIVLNGGRTNTATPVTCIGCRLLPNNPALTHAYFEAITAVEDSVARSTFPKPRRKYAAAQIGRAQHLEHTGDVSAIIVDEIGGGVPARTYNLDHRYPKLVEQFIDRQARIIEAHGVRDRSRFPNRQPLIDALDALDALLDT
jgi:hypothetical protein